MKCWQKYLRLLGSVLNAFNQILLGQMTLVTITFIITTVSTTTIWLAQGAFWWLTISALSYKLKNLTEEQRNLGCVL